MADGHITYDRLHERLVSQSGRLSEMFDGAELTCCVVSDEVHPTHREKVEELQLKGEATLATLLLSWVPCTDFDVTCPMTQPLLGPVKSHHCQLRRVLYSSRFSLEIVATVAAVEQTTQG